MGFLDVLFGDDKKKKGQQDHGALSYMNDEKDNNSEYTDEEIDSYGLDDLQKEEVKKVIMILGVLKKKIKKTMITIMKMMNR